MANSGFEFQRLHSKSQNSTISPVKLNIKLCAERVKYAFWINEEGAIGFKLRQDFEVGQRRANKIMSKFAKGQEAGVIEEM